MIPLQEILAKSRNYGNLTLLEHTQQVAAAITKFAKDFNYSFDVSLAWKAAILHDLGKAHPHFQRKIQNINSRSLAEQRNYNYIHRHEISSLGFLPVFREEEWDVLIDLVIGHHKSIKNDAGEKGILDLIEKYSDCIDNHLKDWEEWHLYGLEVLKYFHLPIRPISKIEATEALNYVIDAQAMVLEIVKALKWLDCRIHIGTATMPSTLYRELLNILGGTESVYEVKLDDEVLDKFDRHTVYKLEDTSKVNDILKNAFAEKEKVLIIYNNVGAAQNAFKQFQEEFPDVEMMLIHSRYRRGDRVQLEHKLKKNFNGDETNEGFKPCLVVSTQVVEVSLDISFDRMITQCAPLDALIQRFGRVNRKRNEHTIGKLKPVHVLKPFGNSLPYKREIIEASFSQLPDNGEVLKERTLQAKIDAVYPILNKKEIDVHLKFKEGKFLLRELTDNKKAVMVEALEIESATCILSSDREQYETAPWEDRLQMEIPINYKTIARHKNKFEQLKIGAYPFVVPQDEDEHKIYGLELIEHETII